MIVIVGTRDIKENENDKYTVRGDIRFACIFRLSQMGTESRSSL